MLIHLHFMKCGASLPSPATYNTILTEAAEFTGLDTSDFYLLYNGRILHETDHVEEGTVYVVTRLVGGKGGFGSMLRAIGAQIEKTTNREACRDLSGRRLRDINEEKRLKNWIAQQAEREQEAAERRQKKLERLCSEPKHEFKDKKYEEERSVLTEKVCDAVEQGFKASTSSGSSLKRKEDNEVQPKPKKKKPRLWIDSEEELSGEDSELSHSDDDSASPSASQDDSNQLSSLPLSLPKGYEERMAQAV